MRIEINNIGKVGHADITIDGITVIGGKNGTGKSTISRALFSLFNGLHDYRSQIFNQRAYSISRYLDHDLDFSLEIVKKFLSNTEDIDALADFIATKKQDLENEENGMDNLIENVGSSNTINDKAVSIRDILRISDKEVLNRLLLNVFSREFYNQHLNIYSEVEGNVSLHIKDRIINVSIDNEGVAVSGEFELTKAALYIDDPFIIDSLNRIYPRSRFMVFNHTDKLIQYINLYREQNAIDSIISDKKLKSIYDKLRSVCPGAIVHKRPLGGNWATGLSYAENDSDKRLSLQNLASGLKTFVLLRILIENGVLEDNGVMIFDEPENHLHPEWQLVLAELIVLIQEEFGMHILINTHSPYFLDAIDVYAARHGIRDKCRFYRSYIIDDGRAGFEDCSNDIEKLYKPLAEPFQILEALRNEGRNNEIR